jgi:beta-glucosidase
LAFSDRSYARVVEPGRVDLWTGDAEHRLAEAKMSLTGAVHVISNESPRLTTTSLSA